MSILIAMAAAGCVGSGDGDGSNASRCVPATDVTADIGAPAGVTALAIAAKDDRFHPRCVELAEPGHATLVVRNEGRHPHNLTVDGEGSVAADAGQVAILEVDVPATGVHYVCTIHPGMEGDIRVRR